MAICYRHPDDTTACFRDLRVKSSSGFCALFFLALALDATEQLRIHELGNFKIHICYYYGGLCNKRWAHYSKWTLHHHYYSFPYNESYYVKRCFSLVLFIYHATLWKVCFFFDCGEWKIPFQLGVAVLVVLSCVGWGPAQQHNSSTPQSSLFLDLWGGLTHFSHIFCLTNPSTWHADISNQ